MIARLTLSMRNWLNLKEIVFGKLVPRPYHTNVIVTKWIFKNKTDELGQVISNKARPVAQGYTQVVGIDFDETFAPVADLSESDCCLPLHVFKNQIISNECEK